MASITISVGTGSYDLGFDTNMPVSLSCDDATAFIVYTIDGSEPIATGQVYSIPIGITSSGTLKAMGFLPDNSPATAVAEATYDLTKIMSNYIDIAWLFNAYSLDVLNCEPWGRLVGLNIDVSLPWGK